MADAFLEAVAKRRTFYKISNSSPIPDARIYEIVASAIKNVPSSFNVQSARAVILLKEEHEKLWDIGDEKLKASLPPQAYEALKPKVAGFRAGYGTVLWFEDQAALETLRQKNPGIQHVIPEWSHHSSGMHQFTVWTALELEGLGCNLQHYNFDPNFAAEVLKTWNLPTSWNLESQLVFGAPAAPPGPRTYAPIEDRLKMISG